MREGFEKTVRTVAAAGSPLIEARLGAGTGAFLMGPDSAEAGDIAEPASRLLARHVPTPPGGQISDLSDVVELVVAVIGYLIGGLAAKAAVFAGAQPPVVNQDGQPVHGTTPPASPPAEPAPAVPAWPGTPQAPMISGLT